MHEMLRQACAGVAELLGLGFAVAGLLGIVLKPGASLDGVRPELLAKLAEAQRQLVAAGLGGLRITSGTDGAGVHRPGSAHFEGRAVDVTPYPREDGFDPSRRAVVAAALRATGLRVLDEYSAPSRTSTAGHLHAELV